MFTNIKSLFNLIYFIYNLYIFTYIYDFFYKSCNVHKKIKVHGKSKIVHQPKSVLAIIYFILLLFVYINFTIRVVILISVTFILIGLVICDRFILDINDKFKNLNRNIFVIFCWKIFHTIFTLIYMCTGGLNRILDNYFNKKYLSFKKIFNTIANLESSEIIHDYEKINKKLVGQDEDNKSNETTDMSDYIVKSKKIKSKNITSVNKKKDSIVVDKKNIELNKNVEADDNDNGVIKEQDINVLNNDIQKLIDKIIGENNVEPNELVNNNTNLLNKNINPNSKLIKEDLREKINSINNNVFGDSSEEIEDITITDISSLN